MSDALFETKKYIVKSSSKLPILLRHLNCYGFYPEYIKPFAEIENHLPNRTYVNYNYYWPKQEYKRQMKEFKQKIEKDHHFIERYFLKTILAMQELDRTTEELKAKDFSQKKQAELVQEIERVWQSQLKIMGCWYFQLQIDSYYGRRIQEELKKVLPHEQHQLIPSLVMDLTANTIEDTDLMKEKSDRIAIVIFIQALQSPTPFEHPEVRARITEHVEKYKYLKTSFEKTEEYTFEEMAQLITEILSLPEEKIISLEQSNNSAKLRENAENLLPKHALHENKKVRQLVRDAQTHTYIRNRRVEIYMRNEYYLRKKLFSLVEEQTGVPISDLLEMKPEEIKELVLQGKGVDPAEMERRKKEYALIMKNYQQTLITDPEEVSAIRKKYERELPVETTEFKGFVASPGYARGTVRIVNGSKDVGKVQEGDILVAKFTLPDFVPAMAKAGAVIADLGGISSHAAIVSRELNKPCVIGLKTASLVLKDGDVVEVDAQKGIVRKLE